MSTCNTSFGIARLRAVLLGANGVPEPGADSVAVSDGTIQAAVGITTSTGDSFEQKNGVGALCAAIKRRDKITGATVGLELCHLEAEMIALMTGARVLTNIDGDAVGLDLPNEDAADGNGVAVEMWSEAWNGSERALDADGNLLVYRWGLPRQYFTPGNFTLENGILRFPLSGTGNSNANFFDGPGNDWPDPPILGALAMFEEPESNMPAATCGLTALAAS